MTQNQALTLTIVESHQCQSNQLFFESIFFASSPRKSVNIYNVGKMGRNFDDYCDFQLRIRCAYTFVVNQLPDSNSFHPPKPRAAKALLTFICDVFLLLKMGSTVGILDPIIEVFG